MRTIVLAILDGVGLREEIHGNAFKQANKPNFDYLIKEYSNSKLDASGRSVGLPEGQMGNSEVGHLNIGAGRIIYQPIECINNAIIDGSFYKNEAFIDIINHVKKNNSKLHIIGLLSDGGVHSHINHIISLLKLSKDNNIDNVYLHAFMDGRDTLPNVGLTYLKEVDNYMKNNNIGSIGTIGGRYYGMDRDKRWDRLKIAYDAMINGIGNRSNNYEEVINNSYKNNIFDEFIMPTIINDNCLIEENDGVIIANFRPDRIIQIVNALTNKDFNEFEVKKFTNLKVSTMAPVADTVYANCAFPRDELSNTLGVYLSSLGYKQLRIAETEKYAHVTYFFDGGKELELQGCNRVLIPSPKVATYDLKPEMSATEITDKLLLELDNNYDLVILNYANGDMVGHTGNMEATIKAIEVVDYNLGRLYNKLQEKNGLLIITSDHGNSDCLIDENNNIITAHTTNKVPFIICDKNFKLKDGKLSDIAPTILKILNIEIPKEMTGNILIEE